MTRGEAEEFLDCIQEPCETASLTPQMHDIGRAVGERYRLGVSDAMLVAATLAQDCTNPLRADLHDGSVVENALKSEIQFRNLG